MQYQVLFSLKSMKKIFKIVTAAVVVGVGWVTCNFTSFSTVFQSYQDNGWMIMKGCMQFNPIYS